MLGMKQEYTLDGTPVHYREPCTHTFTLCASLRKHTWSFKTKESRGNWENMWNSSQRVTWARDWTQDSGAATWELMPPFYPSKKKCPLSLSGVSQLVFDLWNMSVPPTVPKDFSILDAETKPPWQAYELASPLLSLFLMNALIRGVVT